MRELSLGVFVIWTVLPEHAIKLLRHAGLFLSRKSGLGAENYLCGYRELKLTESEILTHDNYTTPQGMIDGGGKSNMQNCIRATTKLSLRNTINCFAKKAGMKPIPSSAS